MEDMLMKTMMKKVVALMLCFVFVLASVVSCGTSSSGGSGSGKGIKIFMALHDESSSILQALVESMTAKANEEGATIDIAYCEKNSDTQKTQIQEAAGKYDVIICRLADASTALQMEVAAAGTPIVFINNAPANDVLKENQYVFVGSYEYDAGRYQAEYIWNGLGQPSSLNAIIIKGQKGHSSIPGRVNSIKYFFRDNNVEVNYVFEDFANWKDEETYKKLDIFKKTKQPFDCIFCNSDAMAMGAIQWLKDNGYDTSKILVAGIDANSDACAAIAAGDMYVSILQDTDAQGRAAMEAAITLANKKSISFMDGADADLTHVYIPFVPVDASNVSNYL